MSGHIQEKSFVVAEARRKWSAADRKLIVEETKGASVSSVARKHGVAASLLFRWRRDAGLAGKTARRKADAFLPVVMQPVAGPSSPALQRQDGSGAIEIELANGCKLRVTGQVGADALKQVIAALGG